MCGQRFARFADRMNKRIAELLVLEMFAHRIDNSLPKLFPAFLMNRFVADDREFVCARRDPYQDRIPLARFVHSQLVKSLRRGD